MSNERNNAQIVSASGQRITALNKYVKAKTVMGINGQQLKSADVIAIYQASIDTRAALHHAARGAREGPRRSGMPRKLRGRRPTQG